MLDGGENQFDIDDAENSKHLSGDIMGEEQDVVYAQKNCFHEDSTANIDAVCDVTWHETTNAVNYIFEGYSCELSRLQDYDVFAYNGMNDTIYRNSGGEGGSIKGGGVKGGRVKEITKENNGLRTETVNPYKRLRDSVNINMRKRDYMTVENQCRQLLLQYPDSTESPTAVAKLYHACLRTDSSGNKMTPLKTFYESLLLNNTGNVSLLRKTFYFLQKCTVSLHQYQSAMTGFQQIIQQYPQSYEGLCASWDYAATSLLLNGHGGGMKESGNTVNPDLISPAKPFFNLNTYYSQEELTERDLTDAGGDTIKARLLKHDEYDIQKFTKEERKVIFTNVSVVLKDDKSKAELKEKILEEKSKSKDEKTSLKAIKELTLIKTLKDVVKQKRPKDRLEHIKNINSDIKRVFGIGVTPKKETVNNLIPLTYEMSQNYPNPFNPVTKINFALPKTGMVKLIIYDILGREIKNLINNETRFAGRYTVEFNGSNLASGVYFARILVNEGKDFMSVKKMILVK
jgi:hypothetical protein